VNAALLFAEREIIDEQIRQSRMSGGFILERVRFELNHDRALSFCFDAFSSREPVSTSLENALV
jgi:hypothetical protein